MTVAPGGAGSCKPFPVRGPSSSGFVSTTVSVCSPSFSATRSGVNASEPVPAYRLVSVKARDATEAASSPAVETPHARIRTNCSTENPVDFRRCGSCGALLTSKRSQETRKTVTIVFSDLKATTLDG